MNNTDIDSGLEYLPVSLENIHYPASMKNGKCSRCKQLNTNYNWCQPCNFKQFQEDFSSRTSGNSEIDKLIQKHQLEANSEYETLEWVPYEQFANLEHLADGGFGKVYKAEWTDGYIKGWDNQNNKWLRNPGAVALKILTNSKNITTDFLREVSYHKLFNKNYTDRVVRCYGITQDPESKNYVIVMRYIPDGNLRHYLDNNYNSLRFEIKLNQLSNIAKELSSIHEKGLVHRDFHGGNILNNYGQFYITDLGLCRPASSSVSDEKIYGVLPYIAPEVLRKQPYTRASDIYSFGIIAYEILTGLPLAP